MTGVASIVAGALISLALIAAVGVLTWHGDIDGQAAIGFFSAVSVGGVAVGAHVSGVKAGARAAERK